MHSHKETRSFTEEEQSGLNPCCNGRCTRTHTTKGLLDFIAQVLILVVMEDALAQGFARCITAKLWVLILVVMEDALALGLSSLQGFETQGS